MQRSDSSYWKTSEVARLLALVESERRYYQDLLAALPVAVAVVGEDQSLVTVNREFKQRFGVSAESLSSLRVADLLPDPKLEQALAEVIAGGQRRAAIDIRLGPKRLRVALRHTFGWQDQDTAEVLMTVEELPESEAATLLLPQACGTVFWLIDRESGRLACLSAHAECEFGLPPEAWQSLESWAETRVHPGDRDMWIRFYSRGDENWRASIDYRMIGPDAGLRYCRDSASADEAEIRVMTVDRTSDLRATRKARLRARMDAAWSLSARLAHVSNNLLMIVSGYSGEILDSLPDDDARRGDIQEIQNAAERLGRLTSQMNPMAAESHAPDSFALADWAEVHGVEVRGEPVGVLLREADLSALTESVRLAWGGGFAVQAETRPDEGETEFRFEVHNKTEAEAEALLDPFAGPKMGLDPEFGPTKHLRRLLDSGCQAWVEECHAGARLVLVAPSEALESKTGQAAEAPRGSVLLVEDEPGLRSLLAKALRRWRREVIEAASAEQAMAALESRGTPVDLLVTDLTLPGLSGGKLALEVRQRYPETPVIFMTGAAEDAEAAALLAADPAVSLLSKPFAVDDLVQRVDQILNQPRAKGASAS